MDFDFAPSPKEDWEALAEGLADPSDDLRALLRKGLAYELNDSGNAQRLILYHGNDLFFVLWLGWFVWSGTHWAQDDGGMLLRRRAHDVQRRIRAEAWQIGADTAEADLVAQATAAKPALAALRARKDELSPGEAAEAERLAALVDASADIAKRLGERRGRHRRHAKSAGNSGPIANMCKEAEPYIRVPVDELNLSPLAINTAAATLEFVEGPDPAGEMPRWYRLSSRPHAREDRITKLVPVAWDQEAEAPVFDAFLADIQPEPEMRDFLQRWFGYSLLGLTTEQKLVFLHGSGRNGKSTLVDVLARVMGDYATSLPIESLTGNGADARKGSEATPDLVRLPGARMVRASEPEEGVRFKEALIKQLTGGEPILIRKMREEFIEVRPIFKLTLSGNHQPSIHGTDEGIWRRLLLVPFDQEIPIAEVDPLLPEKLWSERAGILNWLLAGAQDYLNRHDLAPPETVTGATAQFRDQSDPIGRFLRELGAVTGEPGDVVRATELRAAFQVWQRDEGGSPWSSKVVSNRFSGLAKKEVFAAFKGSDDLRAYRGIRLPEALLARAIELLDAEGPGGRGRSKAGRNAAAEDLM